MLNPHSTRNASIVTDTACDLLVVSKALYKSFIKACTCTLFSNLYLLNIVLVCKYSSTVLIDQSIMFAVSTSTFITYIHLLKSHQEKEYRAVLQLIEREPMFTGWSTGLKHQMGLELRKVYVGKDEAVVTQGSKCDGLYFLVRCERS